MSSFEGKMCQLFTMNAYLQQHHSSCSMRVIILLVSFIALMMIVEACDSSSCHNDSHHMVLCVFITSCCSLCCNVAPSADSNCASSHICRMYSQSLFHLYLSFISHIYLNINAIVLSCFVDSYTTIPPSHRGLRSKRKLLIEGQFFVTHDVQCDEELLYYELVSYIYTLMMIETCNCSSCQ